MWLDGAQVGTTGGPSADSGGGYKPLALQYGHIGAGYLAAPYPDEPHSGDTSRSAYYFNGSIADVGFYTSQLTAQTATSLYRAGTTPVGLLTKITRPSGKVDAQVAYDPVSTTVKTVTDDKGGMWTVNPATVSGSVLVYRSAVSGSAPESYFMLAEGAGSTQAIDEVDSGVWVCITM